MTELDDAVLRMVQSPRGDTLACIRIDVQTTDTMGPVDTVHEQIVSRDGAVEGVDESSLRALVPEQAVGSICAMTPVTAVRMVGDSSRNRVATQEA